MSVSVEIIRISEAKASIKQAIEDKGVSVADDALISDYAQYISQIQSGGGGSVEKPDIPKTDPLTFVLAYKIEGVQNGVRLHLMDGVSGVEYNKNEEGWQTYTSDTLIPMDYEDKLQFRKNNTTAMCVTNYNSSFSTIGLFYCGGNVMSLMNNATSINSSYCFHSLFANSHILTAPELPATILTERCYDAMFSGCTSLVTAPELPATTLGRRCYTYMFQGCTALVNAPELPTTVINSSWYECYYAMFNGCTSLVTAPELPATTLSNNCYQSMFEKCTALVNAPELPATKLAQGCYTYMFRNCTSLVNAPELPATTLANSCYDHMFNGCTSLVNAPELLVTKITNEYVYQYMFDGCTSLVTAPELPATTLGYSCYCYMFRNCTSLVNAPELPATTLANYCYQSMFNGCTSLVTAPELPATTLANYCYQAMFSGCTSLTHSPIIGAFTNTAGSALNNMFYSCSNLKTVTMLNTVAHSYTNFLGGTTPNTTDCKFYYNPAADWVNSFTRSSNTVPSNWQMIPYEGEIN